MLYNLLRLIINKLFAYLHNMDRRYIEVLRVSFQFLRVLQWMQQYLYVNMRPHQVLFWQYQTKRVKQPD